MIFLLFLLLASCSSEKEKITTFSGVAMTIPYTIHVSTPGVNRNQVERAIQQTFEEVDTIYNKWNTHSEVSSLNRLKAFEKQELTLKLQSLFELADLAWKLTDGKFDPTVETLGEIWKGGRVPDHEERKRIAQAVGWQTVHWKEGTFWKDHDETLLDFSGIAKGLGVDLLVDALKSLGYEDLFVEWGGEIRTTGQHPELRPWRIFISRFGDLDPDRGLAFFDLEDQAIATSGDYYQSWKVEGKTYCHLFDPIKQSPLEITPSTIASASVFAPSCALADALASAACLFSSQREALEWATKLNKRYPDIKILFASRSVL